MVAVASQPPKEMPPPPELGGQHVPAKHYEIQFDRKYDLFCSFYSLGAWDKQGSSRSETGSAPISAWVWPIHCQSAFTMWIHSKRAVRPYPPDAAIPAAWPRVAHTSPNRPGRDHAREPRSCSPLPVPRSPLAGVGLSLSSSGTGSLQIRPRVSRRHDRSGRRRTSAIVRRNRVSEPRSVRSTTRTTRRLRRWAPELALATPEVRAELL
jgi:hypothetical protein